MIFIIMFVVSTSIIAMDKDIDTVESQTENREISGRIFMIRRWYNGNPGIPMVIPARKVKEEESIAMQNLKNTCAFIWCCPYFWACKEKCCDK